MARFIIAYDLMRHVQNYHAVGEAINALGKRLFSSSLYFGPDTKISAGSLYLGQSVSGENNKLIVIETDKFLSSTHGGIIPMKC
jgi:hypothetical protein